MHSNPIEEVYSAKTDSELLALAVDRESLREDAQQALGNELRRRHLEAQQDDALTKIGAPTDKSAMFGRLKWLGLWLLNTLIATVGVAINVGIVTYSTQPFVSRTLRAQLVQTPFYPIPFVIGVTVGFFSYLRFRGSYRYWTWLLPAFLTNNSLLHWQALNQTSFSVALAHFFGYIPYPQNRDQLDTSLMLYMSVAYSSGAAVHRFLAEKDGHSPSAS